MQVIYFNFRHFFVSNWLRQRKIIFDVVKPYTVILKSFLCISSLYLYGIVNSSFRFNLRKQSIVILFSVMRARDRLVALSVQAVKSGD